MVEPRAIHLCERGRRAPPCTLALGGPEVCVSAHRVGTWQRTVAGEDESLAVVGDGGIQVRHAVAADCQRSARHPRPAPAARQEDAVILSARAHLLEVQDRIAALDERATKEVSAVGEFARNGRGGARGVAAWGLGVERGRDAQGTEDRGGDQTLTHA